MIGPLSPLLEVRHLHKHFAVRTGMFRKTSSLIRAVDDVSLSVDQGETLGLVGESGCGKSTFARCVLGLISPTSGEVIFRSGRARSDAPSGSEVDLASADPLTVRRLRQELQIIFQDPFSSLNPRMSVLELVGEPLRIQGLGSAANRRDRVVDLLNDVGLASEHLLRFPHEFSGGQRQRIGIARALASNPQLIVADEPLSALDVSVQAQVLNLLQDLQRDLGLTYVLIAHDLAVVKHASDRVAVMYLGRIVELAETDALFTRPRHPYSEALLAAVPVADPDRPPPSLLDGDVPSPLAPPSGCHFHPRCPYAQTMCRTETPELHDIGEGRIVACHFADQLDLEGGLD